MIGKNVVSNEVFLTHHVQELSGGIVSSVKALVVLKGLGIKATPTQLPTRMLNDSVKVECPTVTSLWNAGSDHEFCSLSPATRKDK